MKFPTRALLAASAVSAILLTTAPQMAGATVDAADTQAHHSRQLAKVRAATERFRLPKAAIKSGYVATPTCVQLPGTGGMGYHYASPSRIADGVLDIRRPEVLVYVPTRKGLRLGAVEYFQRDADQNLSTATDRPSLFGGPFDGPMPGHEAGQPIHYDLHVWLYQRNPAGTFATWNPTVTCP